MEWVRSSMVQGGDWLTPAIHVYALVVFGLVVAVFVLHRARQAELVRRIGNVAALIDRGSKPRQVRLHELTGLILYLGDLVERDTQVQVVPVLQFLRREEHTRETGVQVTLVNLTETMIELFPILGILGTVWAISGVAEEFGSQRLLTLFGIAVSTTLFALLYLVIFRITYSAFVEARVHELAEQNRRFAEFLGLIERRARAVSLDTTQGV